MQLHRQWPSRRRRRDVDDEAALLVLYPPRVDAVSGLGAGGALAAAEVVCVDERRGGGLDGWIGDAGAALFELTSTWMDTKVVPCLRTGIPLKSNASVTANKALGQMGCWW